MSLAKARTSALMVVRLLSAVGTALALNSLVNGSFEINGGVGTTNFAGWTEVDTGAGSWFVQAGTTAPLSSDTVPSPTNGIFAAMTSQEEESAQVLFQDFTVPQGAVLRCDIFVQNHDTDFIVANADTLLVGPNQQARIDIMQTSSGPFDLGSAVLQNIFITNPGDPGIYTAYKTISTSIAGLAGQTVRLRLAVVVTEAELHFGVDNCSVTAGAPAPAASTVGLSALVLGLAALAYWRLRHA